MLAYKLPSLRKENQGCYALAYIEKRVYRPDVTLHTLSQIIFSHETDALNSISNQGYFAF